MTNKTIRQKLSAPNDTCWNCRKRVNICLDCWKNKDNQIKLSALNRVRGYIEDCNFLTTVPINPKN